MSHPVIEADECIGCGICVDACPQEVLEVVGGVAEVVNEDACIACGDCVEECPMGAIPEVIEDQPPAQFAFDKRNENPCLFHEAGVLCVRETSAWKRRNGAAREERNRHSIAIVWDVNKTYMTNW